MFLMSLLDFRFIEKRITFFYFFLFGYFFTVKCFTNEKNEKARDRRKFRTHEEIYRHRIETSIFSNGDAKRWNAMGKQKFFEKFFSKIRKRSSTRHRFTILTHQTTNLQYSLECFDKYEKFRKRKHNLTKKKKTNKK